MRHGRPRGAILVLVICAAVLVPTTPATLGAKRKPPDADFWIAFPTNASVAPCTSELSVDVSGPRGTKVKVIRISDDVTDTVVLPRSGRALVDVPETFQVSATETVQDQGIRVKASANISVVAHNRLVGDASCSYSLGSYRAIPTSRLGTSHLVMSYTPDPFSSQATVVGTTDGTTVTVTPSVTVGMHTAGTSFPVVLDAGDTWALRSTDDLSGTLIASDQPIAVLGSADCANVPAGGFPCDMLVESMPPTSRWGTRFIALPTHHPARTGSTDVMRLMGSVDGTAHLAYSPAAPVGAPLSLNAGQWVEFEIGSALEITGSAPILVAQFERSQTTECPGTCGGSELGDPFMSLVPPTSSYKRGMSFAACPGGLTQAATIIVPTAGAGKVEIDGIKIGSGGFSPIDSTGYSVGVHVLDPPDDLRHKVKGPKPLMVLAYSHANFAACGYPSRAG